MKRIAIMLLVMILLLTGCKEPVPTFTEPATQKPTESASATGATIEEPPEIPLEYGVQYIRTDGYHENLKYPGVAVLDSTQDLRDYYNCYYELYDLEPRSDISTDSTLGFGNACGRYGEDFFSKNFLIFVILEEPSGSIRHKVTDVYHHPSEGVCIRIDRIVPEAGTDDMAQWHIILELERRWLVQTPNDVQIVIDGKLSWNGSEVVDPQPAAPYTEPPEGTLHTPSGDYKLARGGYHWTRPVSEGMMESVIADQVSRPLPRDSMKLITIAPQCKETIYALNPATGNYEALRMAGYPVKLSWEVMPDSVKLTCWADGVWVNQNVESEDVYTQEGFSFYAYQGAYIYEITATWNDLGGGTGGSCQYYAYIFGGAQPDQQ